MTRFIPLTALAVAALFTAARCDAALMHPNVMGTDVTMTMIVEDSPTGDSLPLFGPPTASGNNFDFNPTGAFSAQSTNGGLPDATDGKLSFMIVAKQGFTIDVFQILENGIATLLAPFTGTDAFASVSGIVDVDINELNGVATSIDLASKLMSFGPNGGQYLHSVVATDPQFTASWSGGATIDIDAELASLGYSPSQKATKITVTLDNILLASTQGAGTIALIDKKDIDIIITTGGSPVIPEPGSAALVLLGITTVAGLRLRGRRA